MTAHRVAMPITFGPDMNHSAIYRDLLNYLFIIVDIIRIENAVGLTL